MVHGISGYEDVSVGTADSWNVLVDGANAVTIQTSDVILGNPFPYWQGQTMSNSSHSFFDDIMQVLQTVQTVKGSTDVDFWIGETGWPTAGGSYGVCFIFVCIEDVMLIVVEFGSVRGKCCCFLAISMCYLCLGYQYFSFRGHRRELETRDI